MLKINLPIDPYLESIQKAFTQNANLILTAPPGSGKTTRVPAALMKQFKKIIVLVPRRIAAVSTAYRICEENNYQISNEVGYQVRFDNKSTAKTQLIFMTEGVFIKRINDPALWRDLELVIFDEFHERSSLIDMALGICFEKQIFEQKLKLLIMSATLDVSHLKDYLGACEHIEVLAAPHPLTLHYNKKTQRLNCDSSFAESLTETLKEALLVSQKDILIFLPGLGEIRFIERFIAEKFKKFEIAILHGSVKLEEQKRILQPAASRRIILATNIAESSITIPSVDCVMDSGLEKKAISENKIGFKRLELNRISLFSARQRAGRAARTGAGHCYRLWHELDERSMPEQILPEIVNSDLLDESLTLLSIGMTQPDQFSWLDKPKKKFSVVVQQLLKWQLIDSQSQITAKGLLVQSCPLDIERSLLFVELSLAGWQELASSLLAFIETQSFDKQTEAIDIENLKLNDQGRRIKEQLKSISISCKAKKSASFKAALIQIFFKNFAHRIAKKKDKNLGVSSLGRGLEFSLYLIDNTSDYFLLISGRELSDSVTKCDFAIGFSAKEFEHYSEDAIEIKTEVHFDAEKKRLYKIDKKMAGYFTLSESAKTYLNKNDNQLYLKDFLRENLQELLQSHDDYKNYVTKVNFLKKKAESLQISSSDFLYLDSFETSVHEALADSLSDIEDFFNLNLFDILIFLTPESLKSLVEKLPQRFNLPNGKQIDIDYASEQAPKISARIQDFFGQMTNPTLFNGKIRMNIELLAPNYRPAQLTSQLENFWKTSYLEIRKELKARYPKHAWPEDVASYKPEPKK